MNTEHNSEELLINECVASNEVVEKMTIGELLRSTREEKNLSLKVISQHTKISTTILENLESDSFENLPSKAYVIGFVKSYSKTIGLDESECLKLLNEAYGSEPITESVQTPLNSAPPTNPPVEASSSKEIPSQYLTIAGVFVALVILFAIVINSSNNNIKEEIIAEEQTLDKEIPHTPLVDVKPQELSENTPLTQETEEATDEVESSEDNASSETPEEIKEPVKAAEVKKVETKKEEKKVEKTEEKKKVTLRTIPLPLFEVTNDEEVYTHLPENIKAALIQGKQNIFISAVDGDTWITYKSDNDDIKKFVLSKGRTLLIRGDIVRIFLGNVHVARIFLNNKALKITSRSGVKSLVFPQEQAKDYKLPLFLYPTPGKVITSKEYEESLPN